MPISVSKPHINWQKAVAEVLVAGGVGVLPTDTIYGIVGSALDKKVVEKIYRLRKRNRKKPMIVLISSLGDLKKFGVQVTPTTRKILQKAWPGKVSVILPSRSKKVAYLHRGTNAIAFRMPKPAWLRKLLVKTGPLVAPSANIEGKPPARTVGEAKKYFADKVDFYVDAGRLVSKPSTLIELRGGTVRVLR
jgi:L-threonylcarbamoyladenylate synthase